MNIALAKWTLLAGWMLGYCLIELISIKSSTKHTQY